MKCQLCDGKGEYMHAIGGYRPCEHCNGTGKIVQTNEEWFCSLSTEEKAEWLTEFAIRLIPNELTVLSQNIKTYKTNIVEWLKQPYEKE